MLYNITYVYIFGDLQPHYYICNLQEVSIIVNIGTN